MPEWSAARSWGTIGLLSALFSLGMATRSKVANGAPLPTPEEASFLANTNSHRANNRGLARLAAAAGGSLPTEILFVEKLVRVQ